MIKDQALFDRLTSFDLAVLYDRAVSLRKPCIPFTAEQASVPTGGSKLGGLPDLPPGTPWPQRSERPLMFLAQFNLAELPKLDSGPQLPASGLLSFWYDTADGAWGFDPKDRGSFQVLYINAPADQLSKVDLPEYRKGDLDEELQWDWQPYTECAIHTGKTFDYDFNQLRDDLEQSGNEEDLELAEKLSEALFETTVQHKLLGFADAVQGNMALECQLVTNGIFLGNELSAEDEARAEKLEPGAADWQLLLQLDTDDDGPEWMWGDCGRLYFWIRTDDLARADFSQVWGILQCY